MIKALVALGFEEVWAPPNRGLRVFGGVEARHLFIAWLALGFCFSVRWLFYSLTVFPIMFGVALITLGVGFICHESAHKFAAQKFGCWAEFRLWPWGLAMAFMFALLSDGTLIFAAPGAVYIVPLIFGWGAGIGRREYGLISLAGPMVNIVIAILFSSLAGFGGILNAMG